MSIGLTAFECCYSSPGLGIKMANIPFFGGGADSFLCSLVPNFIMESSYQQCYILFFPLHIKELITVGRVRQAMAVFKNVLKSFCDPICIYLYETFALKDYTSNIMKPHFYKFTTIKMTFCNI